MTTTRRWRADLRRRSSSVLRDVAQWRRKALRLATRAPPRLDWAHHASLTTVHAGRMREAWSAKTSTNVSRCQLAAFQSTNYRPPLLSTITHWLCVRNANRMPFWTWLSVNHYLWIIRNNWLCLRNTLAIREVIRYEALLAQGLDCRLQNWAPKYIRNSHKDAYTLVRFL